MIDTSWTDEDREFFYHRLPLDFGHGVRGKFFTVRGSEEPAGVNIAHLHDDGAVCSGTVLFEVPHTAEHPGPKWTLVSLEPLEVHPSIHQVECGLHGFIRGGVWRPA